MKFYLAADSKDAYDGLQTCVDTERVYLNTCTLARVRFRLRRGVGLRVRVRVGLGVRVGFGVHTMHQSPYTPARCRRFPGRVLVTERHCGSERCDFRDCEGMRYSLIDMMNLARTRLILGSGTHNTATPLGWPGCCPAAQLCSPDLVSSYRKPPGWSSYSEVAAYWGGKGGKPVPILLSGRDFGSLVDVPPAVVATSRGKHP